MFAARCRERCIQGWERARIPLPTAVLCPVARVYQPGPLLRPWTNSTSALPSFSLRGLAAALLPRSFPPARLNHEPRETKARHRNSTWGRSRFCLRTMPEKGRAAVARSLPTAQETANAD